MLQIPYTDFIGHFALINRNCGCRACCLPHCHSAGHTPESACRFRFTGNGFPRNNQIAAAFRKHCRKRDIIPLGNLNLEITAALFVTRMYIHTEAIDCNAVVKALTLGNIADGDFIQSVYMSAFAHSQNRTHLQNFRIFKTPRLFF